MLEKSKEAITSEARCEREGTGVGAEAESSFNKSSKEYTGGAIEKAVNKMGIALE